MFTSSLRVMSRRRALLATTAATVILGFGAAAQAGVPITGTQLQSNVGGTVNPDFQGGTLRDNVNAVTDSHGYNVEAFPNNTIDEFGDTVTFTGTFSGAGSLTFVDSVGGGNAIFTGTSAIGGSVNINPNATLTWGNGGGGAFLIGPGNGVVDNGSLVMNFGGASGVVGDVPISGTGSVTVHTGLFEELGPATYTGGTTVDAGGTLTLGNGGSTVGALVGAITDNGHLKFDYAGAAPVTAPNQISGAGSAEFVSGDTVITGSSVISGTVTIDTGATTQWGDGTAGAFLVGGGNAVTDNGALVMNFGGSGVVGDVPISGAGTVEIQSGIFQESGAITITGATTVDSGGTLELGAGGATGTVAGAIVDNGLVQFDHSGSVTLSSAGISGSGSAEIVAGTLIDANTDVVGGAVTIDSGATLQWGNGTGGAFLIGAGNGVVDNGSLVMNFGGASGVIGAIPISGTGSVTVHTGLFEELGPATYTGGTKVDAGGTLTLGNGGSSVGTLVGAITDNGSLKFDYAGAAPVTADNSISGAGSAEFVSGTTVITNTSLIGGTVTINSGATMQMGDGVVGGAFLVGGGNAITNNGALVMDFASGIAGTLPIGGTGTLEIEKGLFEETGVSTYSGTTTIDAAGTLALNGAGSISNSGGVIDNGVFDISGTTAGTSITTLSGSGGVSLGAKTLTLTNASGTFSGVLSDGGSGGGLTLALGTETLTGTNTYTGTTTINGGATLALGNGGTTGSVAGAIVDNGLVQFNYGGSPVTAANAFSGSGSVEAVAGTVVVTGAGFVGGAVTIDPGATMQWGAGGPAFLVGGGDAVVDNGALVLNFGGGGIAGAIPISGSGTLEVQSGSLNEAGASTYTGTTTIDPAGFLVLSGTGSIANSSSVIDNGTFDISGLGGAGTSIVSLAGTGGAGLGGKTLTLTNASGTFGGVLADGGVFGGTGGGLTIGGGTETLTGTNTFTGATTINLGATLQLGAGGATGTVAGAIVDNGLVQFNYGGSPVTAPNAFSGTGSVEDVAGTVVVTGASFVGGTVTIDPGATMQWGAGGPAFLVGPGNSVVDNGALVMNFGGGGIAGSIPISGSGTLEVQSGSLNDSGASTYAGTTTIDPAGFLILSGTGSIADSSSVIDNGTFDISGLGGAGTSITSLAGSGGMSLGGKLLTLTNASGTFGGVLADGGVFGGTGGKLTIAGGTETLTGVNTFTGLTTVNVGATLDLVGAGSIALSDPLVNGTFDISGASPPGSSITSLSGHGHVILGANTLTLTAASDLFSGFISGTGGLTIGAGTEALSGVNTFTGTMLINTGATLQLGDGAGTMGLLAGPITDNGHLLFNGGAATDAIFATGITGSGDATVVSGILGLTGTNTYAGPTTVDVGATLQLGEGGATGTVAGAVVDNGLVQFNYSGAVTTPNTFTGTGAAEVVAGTVVITGASAINGNVTIDPGATLQWGNNNPAFLIGGTGVVDNGALVMNFDGGGVGTTAAITGTGSVTMLSGSFNSGGVNTYTGTTTIDPGFFFLLSGGGSIANSSNVIDNGVFDISGTTAGTSIITLSGAGGVSLGAQTLTLTAASGTFSGVLADGGILGGTGGALTIASGTETLTGTNTFTGPTTINAAATLKLGNGGATGTVTGNVVDNGLVQFNYSGSATLPGAFSGSGSAEAVAGTAVITTGGVLGGSVTIDPGATLQWGSGGPAFLLGLGNTVVDNGALVLNFGGGGIAGPIPISGTGTLEVQSGSLNEAGASTYTGVTTIDPLGILALSGAGSISNSSNLIDNGIFDISGLAGAGTSITSLAGSGGVSLGGKLLTLTNASGTFGGVLADGGFFGGTGGKLTIAGGTETLTGVNTFTGLTTINLGATLKLAGPGSIAQSDPLVNGTFDISGSSGGVSVITLSGSGHVILGANTLTLTNAADLFSGVISGAGGFTIGAGTEILTGVNTYTGTTLINTGATLQLGNGGGVVGLLAGPITDNGLLIFDGGAASDAIFATAITGTGALTLDNGTLGLTGTNTYTGPTTVDVGATLQLGEGGATGTVAGAVIDNGLVQFNYSGSATVPGAFSGSGSAEVVAGTLVATGAGALGGNVTIDPGATLQWGAGNPAFLIGGTGVIDNGALVMNFGSGGVGTTAAISGTGSVALQTGSFNTAGVNTYTGITTINSGGFFALSGTGSIANSSNVIDNGVFDISGTTAGASIVTLNGSGGVSLGIQTLTLTNASGTFSGVISDSGGLGGRLVIAAGTETLTGTNTFTALTTVNPGATLQLGNGGTTGTLASNVVDNGLVRFDYGGAVTDGVSVIGTGSAEVVAGTLVVTGGGAIGGTVTIDNGATMQWSSGSAGPQVLVGASNSVVDNGSLVVNFGNPPPFFTPGTRAGSFPISGTGSVTFMSGVLIDSGVSTYTGTTTINTGAALRLSGSGSIANSSSLTDNGTFDISGTTAGTSIITLNGTGGVSLGGKILSLTAASGTFSGVLADGGASGGTGGGLTIAAGTETLTANNTYTGVTFINTGATLQLGNGGMTGKVVGPVVDNGLVRFNYGGAVTEPSSFIGTGSAEVAAGTLVVTGPGGLGGAVTIDNGATMQWGAGNTAFLVGTFNTVVDNGALVMNFGGGGLGGLFPISGTGSVTLLSGSLNDSGVSTYTGPTTVNTGALLALSGAGSIASSSNVIDNGTFDISGTTAPGTSITTLTGAGGVSLGARTLTLTAASGTFSGVMADGGLSGGTGGGLTIAGGTETLTGTNTFTGPTTVNGGATLNLGNGGTTGSVAGNMVDNGTLNFDRSNTLVISQSISGAGALNQVGTGTTVLDAVNPFTGLTTISAGALEVGDATHAGATLGGNVVVAPGGTLMGHGTIAGSVSNNGVVAPGGTIGVLTVGSYAQGAGGTLAIEVSPAAASQLNSLGPASLNGRLALTFDAGTYSNHIYDILNGHPVTGTFSTVSAAGSPGPGIAFGVFYAPTQVDLVTEATGGAQIYGALSSSTLDRAQNFATLVEDRFGDAGCPDGSADKTAPACAGYGAWAFAIGSWNDQSADGGAFGFRNDGVGVVGGIDRSWENGSLVGGAFGYVHNDLSMDAAAAKATGPSYYGALYGRLVAEHGLWFDGEVFYMHTGWSVDRAIPGIGLATSRPNADSEGVLLQASAPIGDSGLRPYARVTYVLSKRGDAFEGGAGPLGFAINSVTQSAAVGEVGLHYAPTFTTGGGMVVRPALELGVQENGGDRGQLVTGSLAGVTGSAFDVAGPRLWGVAGVVDGSLKVRVNQSFELFGDVRGRFGDHQTDGVASIGGVFRF